MSKNEIAEDMRKQIDYFAGTACVTVCPTRKAKGTKVKRARHDGIQTQFRIRTP